MANPTDLEIIGLKGRAALLRAGARGLNIPDAEDAVPSKQEMQQKDREMSEQAVQPEAV